MAVSREVGFDPEAREWWASCPECSERIPLAYEGAVGDRYATCLTDDVAVTGTVTIASMGGGQSAGQ
jgi:hypothetical protein